MPPSARYFLCTVESMPLDRPVSFLGVDEIQLCADPDRGHVFTDRLLHARGQEETMFLGADTIGPLLRKLAPEAEIITRPRFSTLSHGGARKLTRPATTLGGGHLLGGRGLCPGRAVTAPARRHRGGAGRAQPAHPQRPGRHVRGRRGRLPGRHRRHRHGPQFEPGPRRLRQAVQVRRPRHAPIEPGRDRPDRRARRAPHVRRQLRHHRRGRQPRARGRRGGRGAPLRSAAGRILAQPRVGLPLAQGAAQEPGAAGRRDPGWSGRGQPTTCAPWRR